MTAPILYDENGRRIPPSRVARRRGLVVRARAAVTTDERIDAYRERIKAKRDAEARPPRPRASTEGIR